LDHVALVQRRHITVHGVVQGVGFRPFVYRLAHEHGLAGWVLNHSGGVDIEVEGPAPALDAFAADLETKAPPLARIEGMSAIGVPPQGGEARFEIRHSEAREGEYPLISADIATCPDCRRELLDPGDRRYRYAFTNCTNCGPRFTIIESMPYDRARTTMRDFPMCPACQHEYDDPLDRRFHAQPNACPVCGPRLELVDAAGRAVPCDDVIGRATTLLVEGRVLAIKGLGGFHLACDATNAATVDLLKARKRRPDKPLAVMMATLSEVERHCTVGPTERELLLSPECPIVLLPWHAGSSVAPGVAPKQRYLGVMLPYTPLHHILLHEIGRPLVMTSGNLSEEPIARDNDEAVRRLGKLADFFVLHNRAIYARYDDSVWFVPELPVGDPGDGVGERTPSPQPMRRSRGYAPYPVRLPFAPRPVLASGAELKNTFCLTRQSFAFVSQHIGDMENLETLEHFQASVDLYQKLFRTQPELIAYDLHPDYLASQYARERMDRDRLPGVGVQHHHAHIASCLADNHWPLDGGPVIGVCFDGAGYGLDGHSWGGEFLLADYRTCRRAAHLQYMPLPGGDAAVRNPFRLSLGYLQALFGAVPSFTIPADVSAEEADLVIQQIGRRLNTPLTSSAGRLFDAVAALLGIRSRVSYEAQAAIELEMLAAGERADPTEAREPRYRFSVTREGSGPWTIGLQALFQSILADLTAARPARQIAWEFHHSLAAMVAGVCRSLADDTGLRTVALSGGCFQNRLFLELTASLLAADGFDLLTHHQVPTNDGGLSLGQAVIAGLG
jgi:hydrogenase maturation protein HypF